MKLWLKKVCFLLFSAGKKRLHHKHKQEFRFKKHNLLIREKVKTGSALGGRKPPPGKESFQKSPDPDADPDHH